MLSQAWMNVKLFTHIYRKHYALVPWKSLIISAKGKAASKKCSTHISWHSAWAIQVSACVWKQRAKPLCVHCAKKCKPHFGVEIPAASKSKTWHAPCASGVAWKHLDTVGRSDTHWQSTLDAHVTWLSSEQSFTATSGSLSASSDEGSSSSASSLCHRTIKLSDTSFLIQ